MTDFATYSPEDNKLRLYVGRVPRDEYLELRKEGWKSTPKQDCDFVATWTPAREDRALSYADEIEDEDQSPEDRAADRAERFSEYRDKRRAEAHGHADTFDAGPAAHGYQSQDRAERAARRHDRSRTHALTQWSKAEYWQRRTEGVIAHALYKARPGVRRSRILRLEAEQRKHQKNVDQAVKVYNVWLKISAEQDAEKAARWAAQLAGQHCWGYDYKHPRTGKESSLWSMLSDDENPITGHEAAKLALERYTDGGPCQEGSYSDRWSKHYALRLAYENQMLEAEGGKASEVEMIPGGFIGQYQILKVNKSPVTKRVVSVNIAHDWGRADINGRSIYVDWGGVVNIERLGEDAYRAPTEAELEEFNAQQNKRKAKRKAANAGKPKLINPTLEDAQRLQDELNRLANERKRESYSRQHYTWNEERDTVQPAEVWQMTQAEYSARSKGSYGCCETVELQEGPKLYRKSNMYTKRVQRKTVCKIRKGHSGGQCFYRADRVVVLTDKPQKPLPDWTLTPETKAELEKVGAVA